MSRPIEHYGLIGDTETAALVARDGSVDWWCVPRFDGGACFAALLGSDEHGCWKLGPVGEVSDRHRLYRPGTLILETESTTPGGTVRTVDFMPPRGKDSVRPIPDLVRIVEGVEGRVTMRMELTVRFDYGWVVPWVSTVDGQLQMIAGPDGLRLSTPVETHGEDLTTVAEFSVEAGQRVPFVLSWYDPSGKAPEPIDPEEALAATTDWWRAWTDELTGEARDLPHVRRSLITLKALTYGPTGAIVAAPTTSLPEYLGGRRNWDYRYSWLRDASLTLDALLAYGCEGEARAWRDWLVRATAGDPRALQIMYGLSGERRLPELELPWLPGYADSRPVRVGNAAHAQQQHDVYGELMNVLHTALRHGMDVDEVGWGLQRAALDHLEDVWHEPDNGLWEVRGPRQHFTYSKIMAWRAFDRGVATAEHHGLEGPVERWRSLAETIHAEVCRESFDDERNTFTQAYGSPHLDAALLRIPRVGFLPPDDARVAGTIEAIEEQLVTDGIFVARYQTETGVDGLAGGEGTFLLCSFWLVDALAAVGRTDDARRRFQRLCELTNDVGLLAEEYDPSTERMLGNFPQAFAHVGLVTAAARLHGRSPAP